MTTTESPRLADYLLAPVRLIPCPRPMRRSTFYILFWGGLTVATGAASLAAFTHLASEADAANYRSPGPLPVVYIDHNADPAPTADAPAPAVDPAALPSFADAFDGAVVAAAAPEPVAEVAPVEDSEISVEYVAESNGEAAAEASTTADDDSDIDLYYSYAGYTSTLAEGQALIDACAGMVEMGSYSASGAPITFATHNYCGGTAVTSAAPGTTVAIGNNVFRIDGEVARLSAFTNTDLDIPQGYDALIQSCMNGASDMAFIALTRIA